MPAAEEQTKTQAPRYIPEETYRLAEAAISYALHAICDDPFKYWLAGNGTEIWARLTAAHAALHGHDVVLIRKNFVPDAKAYKLFCGEREENEKLLRYCRERGIKAE